MCRLKKLVVIRDELKANNWAVDAFLFRYKKQEFIVLVKVYGKEEKKDSPYAIVKLEFIKRGNNNESLNAYADKYKVCFPNLTVFRNFFGIEYKENLYDLTEEFAEYFSTFIPDGLTINKEEELKNAIMDQLNKSDSQSSPGSHCFGVQRNRNRKDGSSGQRSPENNQKAAFLRPELYRRLMDDTTISFRFSEDPARNCTDEDILERWAARNTYL
ncbi:DUF6037 family protein [Bacillus sp. FSL R10-2789]|uniref:DUF6037 family protein n=1 Tax=Bacillus sp. FSL R10-2789 TaxID=2954662 RepID=UPI0030FD0F19